MTHRRDSKVVHFAILAGLGFCLVAVAILQILKPVNTVSKAPKAVLASAIQKNIEETDINIAAREIAIPAKGRMSVSQLDKKFKTIGYSLDPVLEGESAVPRLFINTLPYDLSRLQEIEERKQLFFKTLLPLVLKINEDIEKNRAEIWRLRHRIKLGLDIKAKERIWLDSLFARYNVKTQNFDSLLKKVDIIPPSLALAQAAEESGWGTSRFAQEGNALFGQWTFNPNDKGIVPEGREEGKNHRIKAFDSLTDSLKAYVHNLNTHKAYRELRTLRLSMRKNHLEMDGAKLARTMNSYSERGEEYVLSLQTIMDTNNLHRFDSTALDLGTADEPQV